MELRQLRCFVAVADTLHFGRAAQKLDILPASLGRQIKLLEESIGVRLLTRTTRNVSLTETGTQFLAEARDMVRRADRLTTKFRRRSNERSALLRVGLIDSAAAGLLPQLLPLFQQQFPKVNVQLLEQKTIHLIPKLLSGRLDLAIVRPAIVPDTRLEYSPLFHETPFVAVPENHPLASRKSLAVTDMEEQPLIVPDPRSRPHSHDLSIQLFIENGLSARVVQVAEEKQTIVNLVSSGIGLAIVPRWTSRLNVSGVRFLPLIHDTNADRKELALAACWLRNARDPIRENFMSVLNDHLPLFAESA
ncbi:MAG: LysR family transcriptional regulator [Granulosicoccus sp.]|nr:LysR family transcriptional regulator [Granulosicoccus sp.]